ncbi:hypothetical protein [Actinophytocola gossypii]|uniref:Uncharacterized protein n=1 Tax=Actinophytocola gossypii TaxID=2812003 RepID=A0ABT2JFJ9_9PSEU|nr:hypothetical protein [Actinophytocola gossypii]MCT2586649.1 hypothetical protein [Actinophytocola gossypii]
MTTAPGRPLRDRERRVAAKILSAAAGTDELVAQLPVARVRSGAVTFLNLAVPAEVPHASVPDGPLPVSAVVNDPDGHPLGEIIVWVEGGLLSALEYAWVTDEEPGEWPAPEHVSTSGQSGP